MDVENVVDTHNGIFSSLKKEILSFMTTWIDLENIMLREVSRHRKTTTVLSYLYIESKIVKLIETETRMMIARAWGEGKWECDGQNVQFQIYDISSGDLLYSTVPIANSTTLYT